MFETFSEIELGTEMFGTVHHALIMLAGLCLLDSLVNDWLQLLDHSRHQIFLETVSGSVADCRGVVEDFRFGAMLP